MITLLFFLCLSTLSVVIYAQHVAHREQLAEAEAGKTRIIAAWQQHCDAIKRAQVPPHPAPAERRGRCHITHNQAARCRSLRAQGQTIRRIAWMLRLSERQVRRALSTVSAEVTHRPAPAKGGKNDVTPRS